MPIAPLSALFFTVILMNPLLFNDRQLEKLGKDAAVIYGSLPAQTKLAMAAKFNDPEVIVVK